MKTIGYNEASAIFNKSNKIYKIYNNIDLEGKTLSIPSSCTLDFQGGVISNGTVTGANTGINAGLVKIFNTDVTLAGTWSIAEAYPEWFDAKGNGRTDDTVPIQKTIDFASLKVSGYYGEITGLCVVFKAGVYKTTDTLVVSNNAGISIIGKGKTKSTIYAPNADRPILTISGNNFRGEIKNMRFAGPTSAQTNNIGINISNSGNQIDILNCWFNNLGIGIKCAPSSDSIIADNTMEYVVVPISVTGTGSMNFTIKGNHFYNVGLIGRDDYNYGCLFEFSNCENITFTENIITNDVATGSNSWLFKIVSCKNFHLLNNIFWGNKFRAGNVYIDGCENVNVLSNNFPPAYGNVYVQAITSSKIEIENNVFSGFVVNDKDGIIISGCDDVCIENNSITSVYLNCIYVKPAGQTISQQVKIIGNVISKGGEAAAYSTIRLSGGQKDCIVCNNIVKAAGSNDNDITADLTNGLIITDNIVKKPIYVDGSCTNIVNANNITN